MGKNRLEAFSDGVLAIIITIMVLELKVPHGSAFSDLLPAWPIFLSYVLSFVYIAIYWNNHHHMLHTVKHVSGGMLWANMHLLFWLSLFPFATAWMGENHFTSHPTAAYGCVLLMAAISYYLLQWVIIHSHGRDSMLGIAVGPDWKGKLSPFAYVAGILVAFWSPWLANAIYSAMALVWVVPDRRIERVMNAMEKSNT